MTDRAGMSDSRSSGGRSLFEPRHGGSWRAATRSEARPRTAAGRAFGNQPARTPEHYGRNTCSACTNTIRALGRARRRTSRLRNVTGVRRLQTRQVVRDRRLFARNSDTHPVWRRADYLFVAAGGLQSVPHAGAVCPHYVLPLGYEAPYDARIRCLAQPPIARWPDFWPGVPAGPRCLASRDQVSTRETSRNDQLQGPAFRLRSARTHPGSSVAGLIACTSSGSRGAEL
jgi:hypothetical protein